MYSSGTGHQKLLEDTSFPLATAVIQKAKSGKDYLLPVQVVYL